MVALTKASAAILFGGVGLLGVGVYAVINRKYSKDDGSEDSNGSTPPRLFREKFVRIPMEAVGLVLGRRGKRIRLIEWETKTFLQIKYYELSELRRVRQSAAYADWDKSLDEENWDNEEVEADDPTKKYAFLRIQAKTERQIELVCLAIDGILSDFHRGNVTDTIYIPDSAVGYIIGKQGTNIKRIQSICQIHCQIHQKDGGESYIELSGSQEGIEQAKLRIEQCLYRASSILEKRPISEDSSPWENNDESLEEDINGILKLREELAKEEEEVW